MYVVLIGSVLYLIVYGMLAAGYLGSIQAYRRDGEDDFLANVRRYGQTFVVLTLVILGVSLVAFAVALAVPPLLLLVVPFLLAIGYLFWGTPFLVPVADLGAIPALRWSYRLAVSEGEYVALTLLHLVLAGALSLVATPFVMGTPTVGLVLGLAFVVPTGYVLTVGSLRVIDDLAGRSERSREPDDTFEAY